MDGHALDLAREIGSKLTRAGWHLATAESCSGGLIGHMLTEVPGSSAYYQGGLIAYSNAVKSDLLGVAPETLLSFGAVSEPCALEMASGVRRLLQSEVALSTTGIAGPDGGSEYKPVGLVYIAVATPVGVRCAKHVFSGDRTRIKEATAIRALEILCAVLDAETG